MPVEEHVVPPLRALRVVHRLRQRYRELLEAEIANTVSCPEEIAEERRYLLRVLS